MRASETRLPSPEPTIGEVWHQLEVVRRHERRVSAVVSVLVALLGGVGVAMVVVYAIGGAL